MRKTLGDFEVLLLLSLVRLKEEAYGASIHREIEARTGRSIPIGAIYTGLARLTASGHVTAHVGEPTPQRGGRRRKYYHLESSGALALTESLEALRGMTAGVEEELEVLACDSGTGGAS